MKAFGLLVSVSAFRQYYISRRIGLYIYKDPLLGEIYLFLQ